MLTHHDNHRRFAATLTTSRCIDAAPRHLARLLQRPSLFTPSPTEPKRPPPIAIDLNPAPDGRGAVTLHCVQAGISERRPLRMRQLSPARITAETGNGPALRDADETFALVMAFDLTALVQPGPTIATCVTLSFQFVREPWWPRNLMDALSDLADKGLEAEVAVVLDLDELDTKHLYVSMTRGSKCLSSARGARFLSLIA